MLANKSTILIVDDEELSREVLGGVFIQDDYHLIFAGNGRETLTKAAEFTPDLILLDVMLPDMDGFEVCQHLRADPVLAEVPIIIVTALDDRQMYLRSMEVGADDYVTKPFEREELRTRVKTIIQLNRYRHLLRERTKYEQIIEVSSDGILIVNDAGEVHLANPAMLKMLAADSGTAVLGQQVSALVVPDNVAHYTACFNAFMLKPTKALSFETEFLCFDGRQLPVEVTTRYFSLDGRPAAQIVVRDLSKHGRVPTQSGLAHLELTKIYEATIEGWSRSLNLRDEETEEHTLRVTKMTVRLARAMGVREDDLIHIRRGALLHDIGKIGVPDSILLKSGPLTAAEWEIMRQHPILAYEMLSPINFLQPALAIPHYHHEKWDGSGYPDGLKGEAIPLAARIFAVVDVWDALSTDRPYRPAWPEEKVRIHIREKADTHFDPAVVTAFLALDW